jgi:hypothetical protein
MVAERSLLLILEEARGPYRSEVNVNKRATNFILKVPHWLITPVNAHRRSARPSPLPREPTICGSFVFKEQSITGDFFTLGGLSVALGGGVRVRPAVAFFLSATFRPIPARALLFPLLFLPLARPFPSPRPFFRDCLRVVLEYKM